MAPGRHGTGKLPEILHLTHKKIESLLGMAWTFETRKPTLSDTPTPTRPTPPNLSQIVLLTADQAFKYMSLWGTFSFKVQYYPREMKMYVQTRL